MSEDLIRREDAINETTASLVQAEENGGFCNDYGAYESIREYVKELIFSIPSADLNAEFAEWARHLFKDFTDRPQGKWIKVDDVSISCRCSVCGWEAHLYEDDVYGMPYCPNCGCQMKGADDE